ncbi:hypothetical protein Q8A73_012680 [Channa argus]|nr:hypothetical protein Q8A73_012680 [Channa argus]
MLLTERQTEIQLKYKVELTQADEVTATLSVEGFMMLFHTDRKPLKSHLCTISVLVFQLILTRLCRGQSKLIGSSQPIVAPLGEDIILPCHLEPMKDAAGLTMEWTRSDLNPRFVHVWRSGQELVGKKHKSFEGRTSLFIDELKNGNISLKISKLQLTDEGTYRCFIPALDKESFVQLVINDSFNVQSSTSPVTVAVPVSLVVHPTECSIRDESSISPVTVGLAVSLAVCFLSILLLALILWKKQNIIKSKIGQWAENDKGQKKNGSKTRKNEAQVSTEDETEREQLMTDNTVQMDEFDGENKNKHVEHKETELQQLHEEKQEKEKNLQTLKNKLEDKNKELETVKAQLAQWWFWSPSKATCQRKKTEVEKEVETLKKQLETMETELQTKMKEINQHSADNKWKETNKILEETQCKLEQTKRHADQLMAENKILKEEKQTIETERQWLQKELENIKPELIRDRQQPPIQ